MKKITSIILILVSIYGCKKNDPEIQYVSALKGLTLRQEPTAKGKSIIIIPFKSKIEILKTTEKKEQIDGITDFWCKIKWNNYEGWVFKGYLKPLAQYDKNIFLYNYINTDSFVNDEFNVQKDSIKPEKFFPVYFKAIPDILIDNEVIVVDQNNIYTDYINNIYADLNVSGWSLEFDLKSGKKFKSQYRGGPLFIRKTYYDTLSKTLPVISTLNSVVDKGIEDIFFKEILNFKGDYFHFGTDFYSREVNETNVKEILTCTTYKISTNSYLMLFEETSKNGYTYFCFIEKGHIVKAHGGRFICAFTSGKVLYLFFDSWEADTGWSGKMLFKCEEGEIEMIEVDFTFAV